MYNECKAYTIVRISSERNESSMKLRKLLSILCAIAIVVTAMSVMAFAAEGDIVLFEGERTIEVSWNVDVENVQNVRIYTNGENPLASGDLVPGGYFTVTYTGDAADAVYMVLQGWGDGGDFWGQLNNASSVSSDNGVHVSTFTYADCLAAVTAANASCEDLSGVDSIYIAMTAAGPITVTNVTWHAPSGTGDPEPTDPEPTVPPAPAPEGALFSGSSELSGENLLDVVLSEHDITFGAGGYFSVYYTTASADDAGNLRMGMSWENPSGAWNWAEVSAPDSTKADGASYVSTFTYESLLAAYGAVANATDSLADLYKVCVGPTNGKTVTVTAITWTAPTAGEDPTTPDPTEPAVPDPTEPAVPDPTEPAPTEPEATEPEATEPPLQPDTVVNIYSGSVSQVNPWSIIIELPTSSNPENPGTFDTSVMAPGGYFSVTYTGTEGEIYLVVNDYDAGNWPQIETPTSTRKVGDSWVTTFSYAACVEVYGSDDFSGMDRIVIGTKNSSGETVVTDVSWVIPGSSPAGGESAVIIIAAMAMLLCAAGVTVLLVKRRSVR